MKKIDVHTLSQFSPISLGEMDNVQLMNRTDTKFLFPVTRLDDLLNRTSQLYRILEINGERNSKYTNTYLDTPHHLFYDQHLKGKLNRHKVRYRIYETTGVSYLEIKYKTNQQRTLKWRIKNNIENRSESDATRFLSNHLPQHITTLSPAIINRFRRITLVNLENKERVTLDYDISFSNLNGENIDLPYLAIAELKREGYSNGSPFLNILKDLNIRPGGFSKYCMGYALLHHTPRMNLLKPKILLLQKLKNEYDVCKLT